MNKANILIFALIVIISALALTTYLRQTTVLEKPIQNTAKTVPEKPEKQAIVHYPVPVPLVVDEKTEENETVKEQKTVIPTPIPQKKFPTMEQSDENIKEALSQSGLKKSLFRLVLLENFIQRLVATIDNLPEKRLPRANFPLAPPKGRFVTAGTTDAPQISSKNQSRYNSHVQLLETLDQDLILKTYVYLYPLFQKAYEQLGYRNAYFNDRLVYVIDNLLQTPQPAEPILLAQPSVLYLYADPLLERLSSGQKILLRIGAKNRQKVMAILTAYRERLVDLHP